MATHEHSLLRQGVSAGILGGSAVALWFLLLDVIIEGRPFYTPNLLGQLVFQRGQSPAPDTLSAGMVIGYTLLHFAAFSLFGVFLTQLVRLASRHHIWRFALVIVLAVFEVFFIGFTFILVGPSDGDSRWWTILVGNTFALIAMGAYYYPRYPAVRHGLMTETLGD
jgi:hypothetical protein